MITFKLHCIGYNYKINYRVKISLLSYGDYNYILTRELRPNLKYLKIFKNKKKTCYINS